MRKVTLFVAIIIALLAFSGCGGSGEIRVTVLPSVVNVTVGDSVQFIGSTLGTLDPAVTWSVQEAGGGTITTNGYYTAPQTAGTYHVIAKSRENPLISDMATVIVEPSVQS